MDWFVRTLRFKDGSLMDNAKMLRFADFIFDEAKGNQTLKFRIPKGATILDQWAYPLSATWQDVTAVFSTTDGTKGYLGNVNLQTDLSTDYDPTNVTVAGGSPGNFASLLGFGVDFYGPNWGSAGAAGGTQGGGTLYPNGGVLSQTVSGVTSPGGTGKLLSRILYLA